MKHGEYGWMWLYFTLALTVVFNSAFTITDEGICVGEA